MTIRMLLPGGALGVVALAILARGLLDSGLLWRYYARTTVAYTESLAAGCEPSASTGFSGVRCPVWVMPLPLAPTSINV
jgi:hypothetical protein